MRYLEIVEAELKSWLLDPIMLVEVQLQSYLAFGARRYRKPSMALEPVWKLRPFCK